EPREQVALLGQQPFEHVIERLIRPLAAFEFVLHRFADPDLFGRSAHLALTFVSTRLVRSDGYWRFEILLPASGRRTPNGNRYHRRGGESNAPPHRRALRTHPRRADAIAALSTG